MSEAAFAFENLSKVYRLYASPRDRLLEALTGRPRHTPVHALRGVSATVPRGSVLGVIGENGSGKSTLLRCVNRLVDPTEGRISIFGREVT